MNACINLKSIPGHYNEDNYFVNGVLASAGSLFYRVIAKFLVG